MSIALVQQRVVQCHRCPRLRAYCARVAHEKKPAHRDEPYWGKPVPGFGDPRARLLILGLAPAAHGANRTGRLFTGDGSGDFLMRALHRAGFASSPSSRSAGDGLTLLDSYLSAAVRCAPPANKPSRDEIAACRPHLEAELRELQRVRLVVALGRIAFDAYLATLASRGIRIRPRPSFRHGARYEPQHGPVLLGSYHPSRQNTNTRRLTPEMLEAVFERARQELGPPPETRSIRFEPAPEFDAFRRA
jgi:uracil-DNA glycosylase